MLMGPGDTNIWEFFKIKLVWYYCVLSKMCRDKAYNSLNYLP